MSPANSSGNSAPSSQNRRGYAFLLCSFSIHVALFGAIWQIAPMRYGLAGAQISEPQTVTVRLVDANSDRNGKTAPAAVHAPNSSTQSATRSAHLLPATEPSPNSRQAKGSEETSTHATVPAFLPAGQLTRLPVPAYDIDLNIADIALLPYEGTVDLTLFIDAGGSVANVVHSGDSGAADAFIELIAQRFRNARFIPGEVNGKPVHSQVKITVVSESLSAQEMQGSPKTRMEKAAR